MIRGIAFALVALTVAVGPAWSQYANPVQGSAPVSPGVVDANGQVWVAPSVGLPDVARPQPARYCAVSTGGCALEGPVAPGLVCNCRTPTGGEIGIAAR